jgi:alkylation response protein AidB-like acyl-CoA dehydrogenase
MTEPVLALRDRIEDRGRADSEAELTTQADAHPLVARAKVFAHQVLKPAALDTDRAGVSAETIGRLRELGLLQHHAASKYGGAPLDAAAERRIHEHIAYGCLNTWLVWAQHFGVRGRLVRAIEAGEPPGELETAILRGEVLAGAGVSDVRGFPDRYIEARRTPGGWLLDGTISWVSGWGLNSALFVAGVEVASERVVVGLVRTGEHTRATPLQLSSVGGSRTQRVVLAGAVVPDENVLDLVALSEWERRDRAMSSNAGPHAFGLAAAVLDELRSERHRLARRLVESWAPRVARLREDAYRLAALVTATEPLANIDERVAIKVEVGEALTSLTRALVVLRSGRAIDTHNTAQLYARGGLFVLVQGQTRWVKDAQLASLIAPDTR